MDGRFKFFATRGWLLRDCLSRATIAVLWACALASADSGFAQSAGPKESKGAVFQPEARKHISPKKPEEPVDTNPLPEPAGEVAPAIMPEVTMTPTRSSFLAVWKSIDDATGYRIDVSTDPSFSSYVNGYEHRDVGDVTSRIVSRLNAGTKYYYRVQPYNSTGRGPNSEIAAATTTTVSALVINPTFDSSITGDPKSAAIQSMINQVIALYPRCSAIPSRSRYCFGIQTKSPTVPPLRAERSQKASMLLMAFLGGHTFLTSRQTQRLRMTQRPTPACRTSR